MDDKLKKFAVLVEIGSFTAAAKVLHISQPALTLAINKLERRLKTPLLVRDRRHLELTDAGQIVYAAAVEHRTTDENLGTKLTELAGRRPDVTVGMIDSVAAALNGAAEPLDRLEDAADLSILVNNSRYLRAAVENREIDLAFAVHDDASHPNLDIEPIGDEPFVLVCRPDRLQDFQTVLGRKELPDFISYDRYSTTYGHLLRGLSKLGVDIRTSLYSTNPDIMLHTVLRGRGVAALPYLLTKDLLESGKLAALEKNGRVLTIGCPLDLVRRRGKLLPKALEDFSSQAEMILGSIRVP
jgi:LysR family transcriptional regulator, transcriptional activator of the cysJI operon